MNIFFSYFRSEEIENAHLKPGDRLTVWVANDGTEYGRLDSVKVFPSPRPPTAEEIAAMKPPVVADPTFGKLIPLVERRDLSAEEIRPEGDVTLSRFLLLLPARAGERIHLDLTPNNSRASSIEKPTAVFLGAAATGLEAGESIGAEISVAFDPETRTGSAEFLAPATGLYRIQGRACTPSAKGPHVFLCAPLGRELPPLMGTGDFCFFVPKGTPSFALTASALGGRVAEVTLLTPQGTISRRTSLEAKEELAVRVPEGQDDGIWTLAVRGISPVLALRGTPPFVATHPRHLLVPVDALRAPP